MGYPQPFEDTYEELFRNLHRSFALLHNPSWAQSEAESRLTEGDWRELSNRRFRVARDMAELVADATHLLKRISPEEERALYPLRERE